MKSPVSLFVTIFLFCFSTLHAQENQQRPYEHIRSSLSIQAESNNSPVKQKSSVYDSNTLYSSRHLPRTGDQVIKLEAAYIRHDKPGENVTWDFNHLRLTGEEYAVDYQVTPSSSLTGIENATMHSYAVSGDTLLIYRYESPLRLIYLEKLEEIMIFPMSYGEERVSHFYGKGTYCDRMEMDVSGITYSRADGSGTLVLPENDTIEHVLRVYTAKITWTDPRPLSMDFDIHSFREHPLTYDDLLTRLDQDTIYTFTETYRWYAEGSRYPVLETGSSQTIVNEKAVTSTNHTYVYHPIDQQKELSADPENQQTIPQEPIIKSVTENEELIASHHLGIKTYPNPVVNELQVEFRLNHPEKVSVFVYTPQGQLLIRRDFSMEAENHIETIDMRHLEKGSYFLKVQAGATSENKVILKQ